MARLGIDVQAANSLLNNAFGQRQIWVITTNEPVQSGDGSGSALYPSDISALEKMFVINNKRKGDSAVVFR
ncbi:hypothetical protein ACNKHU_12685 [Shigella flexneri]